ncbi:hypothetical protein [Nonomuraea sp. NPDC048826]|uniref:hypothetical protein n=1 Tax=Nonomuraea sp. NPDC048826 TaxID=3364347 RepID=UPI00371E674B
MSTAAAACAAATVDAVAEARAFLPRSAGIDVRTARARSPYAARPRALLGAEVAKTTLTRQARPIAR